MSAEVNAALVRRLIEAHNNQDDDAIEGLMAEGAVMHPLAYRPVSPTDGTSLSTREEGLALTRELQRRNHAAQREAFPDEQITVDALFAADSVVTAVVTNRGTHRSGKAVAWKTITIYRIDGGKVVELWRLADWLGFYQQLGVVPETPELRRQIGAVR